MRSNGWFGAIVVAHFIGLGGCYDPALRDCTVQCSAPTDCAGGQQCSAGWCAMPGHGSCDDPLAPDAHPQVLPDGSSTPDSSEVALCELGCTNGTCDAAGVCVVDCSATGSCDAGDVQCPPNIPCRVVCGDDACAHHIICGSATSCEVQCSGTSSCGDEIRCSTGPCDVTCSGENSCHRRTKCGAACSCDVTCSGTGACAELSECPMTTSCQLGRGCSSLLPGCDTCAI